MIQCDRSWFRLGDMESQLTQPHGKHYPLADAHSTRSKLAFATVNPIPMFRRLVSADFKGDFEMSCGSRCFPLTILDDHSRYSLGIIACANQRRATVKDHFRSVFQNYGIPRAIYVDNGNPGGNSNGRTRHSQLSAWLMRQDIKVIHGQPHHPQGRGKIERFHRTLKLEVLQDRRLSDLVDAQSAFDPWRSIYNHERPHESLDLAAIKSAIDRL